MSTNIERRVLKGVSVRASKSGGHMLVGYAAKYSVSAQLPGYREMIAPGAFKRVLADPALDCRFLGQHDPSAIFGRTTAGTLRLTETRQGLHYEVDLPDTQAANDLWTSVQRGDISGSSFGFVSAKEDSTWAEERMDGQRVLTRTINNFASLMDVSAVTYPAYHDATCEARHLRYRAPMSDCIKRQFERVIEVRNSGSKTPIWQSPLAQFIVDADGPLNDGLYVQFTSRRAAADDRMIARRKNLLNQILSN